MQKARNEHLYGKKLILLITKILYQSYNKVSINDLTNTNEHTGIELWKNSLSAENTWQYTVAL